MYTVCTDLPRQPPYPYYTVLLCTDYSTMCLSPQGPSNPPYSYYTVLYTDLSPGNPPNKVQMMSRHCEQESLWGHKIHLYLVFAHLGVSCTRDCNFYVLGVRDRPFFEPHQQTQTPAKSCGVTPENPVTRSLGEGRKHGCFVNSIFFRELGKVLASNSGRKN